MAGAVVAHRMVDVGRSEEEVEVIEYMSKEVDRESHAQPSDCGDHRRTRRKCRRRRQPRLSLATATSAFLAASAPVAMAQSCISLADSTACPAFNASSISTNSNLTGLFPFLSSVTDTASFDSGLEDYIANGFTRERYVLCDRKQLKGDADIQLDIKP